MSRDPQQVIFSKWEVTSRRRYSPWYEVTPSQMFAGSFLLLILLGTVGFRTLPGLYADEPLTWLDALFTATSAVCITGLIVVDTATFFTTWGQAYVLLLIQVGGLGMLTFTTLIIIALGRRLSLRQEVATARISELTPEVDPVRLLRNVVLFTFTFEAIGALLLFPLLLPHYDHWTQAVWPAIFQSVSAFCNAGFATYSDSMIGFQQSPGVLLVMTVLIVIGATGFLTLSELYLRSTIGRHGRIFRISLHSRIVLAATVVLLVGAWIAFAAFEWRLGFRDLSIPDKLVNALFMSASARTAGFNNIDHGTAADNTNFLSIILMAIGGSPSSTAGGLKTTTVALIGLYAWSRFRGLEVTSFWARSVPAETIQRAVGLFVAGFGIMTFFIFVFTVTEYGRLEGTGFLHYMFEVVSAFCTNGLSMGVTPGLSEWGKMSSILMMFVGRVGPLTFAAALAKRRAVRSREFRYAYEDVVVG